MSNDPYKLTMLDEDDPGDPSVDYTAKKRDKDIASDDAFCKAMRESILAARERAKLGMFKSDGDVRVVRTITGPALVRGASAIADC